jgi:hypothetical protein
MHRPLVAAYTPHKASEGNLRTMPGCIHVKAENIPTFKEQQVQKELEIRQCVIKRKVICLATIVDRKLRAGV